MLVDAAILDVGVVSAGTPDLDVVAEPGPRTGSAALAAREWDLLEVVYEAWLNSARSQAGRLNRRHNP